MKFTDFQGADPFSTTFERLKNLQSTVTFGTLEDEWSSDGLWLWGAVHLKYFVGSHYTYSKKHNKSTVVILKAISLLSSIPVQVILSLWPIFCLLYWVQLHRALKTRLTWDIMRSRSGHPDRPTHTYTHARAHTHTYAHRNVNKRLIQMIWHDWNNLIIAAPTQTIMWPASLSTSKLLTPCEGRFAMTTDPST